MKSLNETLESIRAYYLKQQDAVETVHLSAHKYLDSVFKYTLLDVYYESLVITDKNDLPLTVNSYRNLLTGKNLKNEYDLWTPFRVIGNVVGGVALVPLRYVDFKLQRTSREIHWYLEHNRNLPTSRRVLWTGLKYATADTHLLAKACYLGVRTLFNPFQSAKRAYRVHPIIGVVSVGCTLVTSMFISPIMAAYLVPPCLCAVVTPINQFLRSTPVIQEITNIPVQTNAKCDPAFGFFGTTYHMISAKLGIRAGMKKHTEIPEPTDAVGRVPVPTDSPKESPKPTTTKFFDENIKKKKRHKRIDAWAEFIRPRPRGILPIINEVLEKETEDANEEEGFTTPPSRSPSPIFSDAGE